MRFSSRLHWDLQPNPLSTLLASLRSAGAQILDLTESNPTRAGIDYPAAEILRAISDKQALQYAPLPAGSPEARGAVAEYYSARGVQISPEQILLTASTSEAYAYLFKLLTDPGDEILVPQPSYPLFEFLAGMELVHTRPYALDYDGGWHVDFHSMEQAVTSRTRAIVVVHPNNPTGSYLKRNELARLQGVCTKYQLALIADEVFSDYSLCSGPDRVETLAGTDNFVTFSLSGLSKVAALPQMKAGWIVASGPAQERTDALERVELIADTYLSVGTPVQLALPHLLSIRDTMQTPIKKRLQTNLDYVRIHSASSPCRLLETEGGWCATLQVPRTRSEEAWTEELLREHNILVQPGFFYDFPEEAHLVLSLLTPPPTFREGVDRILRLSER